MSLQVARGVAANLVVLSHLSIIEKKYAGSAILPAFSFYGIAGVDLFFVLSGFIMVAVAGRNIGPVRFLWRRAARIYPTYWLVSLVVLAVSLAAPAMVNSSVHAPISLWRSFLLVPDATFPLVTIGWTLVHEVYFYLVFALILALRIPVSAGLAVWALALILVVFVAGDAVTSVPLGRVWTSPLTAEFVLGAAVGLLYLHKWTHAAAAAAAIGLAALAASVVFAAPAMALVDNPHIDAWRVVLFGVPAALVIYGLAGREQRSAPRPARWTVALGDWSYATYLTHVLVLTALGRFLQALAPPGVVATAVLVVFGALAANLTGAVLFWFFERPTLALLHRLGTPRRPVARGPEVAKLT